MRRPFDWVFFDAGETLFQVADPLPEYGDVLAHLGYVLSPEQIAVAFGRARWEARHSDYLGPPPHYAIDAERARARRTRFIQALVREMAVSADHLDAAVEAVRESLVSTSLFGLYPETVGVLRALASRGYRMGIISNWEPRLEVFCRNHGIGEHFSFILASEAEGYAKPGPGLFRRALELAGTTPDRAIHVGDSFEQDVLGAAALNIAAVLLDRGGYYTDEEWEPTISSLDELLTLL